MFDAAELDRVVVPAFEFPWPGNRHGDAASIEREMIEWGVAHRLVVDDRYLARVTRTRYAYLAARCYPRADRPLLRVIADYFLWFFLADDLFVDRVDTATPHTIGNLTRMIDVLDLGRAARHPVYGETAWADVCQRLARLLTAEHLTRFADGMRLWASTAGLQILNHLQARSITIAQYETIRRHTSGMNPCLALSDAANAGMITGAEYHHPDVHRLRMHANNVVCWSNDIQSLRVEARQPGQFRNMVTIYAAAGRTLQQAVDHTAARVRDEISAFTRLADSVGRHATPQLTGFLDGLRDWMRGYQDWVDHDTHRYDHAEHDADDRGTEVTR